MIPGSLTDEAVEVRYYPHFRSAACMIHTAYSGPRPVYETDGCQQREQEQCKERRARRIGADGGLELVTFVVGIVGIAASPLWLVGERWDFP